MTEEIKKEEKETQVAVTGATDVKAENKEEEKDTPQVLEPVRASASAFITKDDIFDVKVRFYVRGIKYFVENVTEFFDKKDVTNQFTIKCRIPTQEDVNVISQRVGSKGALDGEMTMFKAFNDMEYIRLVRLMKDWDLTEPCVEASIEKMHPEIVKGMVVAIRNKLEMTAIV